MASFGSFGGVKRSALASCVLNELAPVWGCWGEVCTMAMQGGRYGPVLVLVAAVIGSCLLLQFVDKAEASYGMMEFSSPASLSLEEQLQQAFEGEDEFLDDITRRMLAQRRRSYIAYGALYGNRSPCPAGSGRSYYTPNCGSQRGPVRPYRRACLAITHCARGR